MYRTILSSKGQLVLPAQIREEEDWFSGTEFVVEKVPEGILLIPVPKDPVAALYGIAKGAGIKSSDIKKMRQEDEKKR
ncbi:MAG TPA: AbrB/MazE/SpoVT family DNA-binding domain-containing protein [archaeon]|nr:AbrB/MazE/SpoVT family DNA-binding domain-containing protein [archaeon]